MKDRDEHSEVPERVFGAATPIPAVQLLSNGLYHLMVTNAGGGYSRWKDIAVTRWREDSTRDNWGTFCYLRDVANGAFWSTTFQPTLNPSAAYEANLSEACAAFRCSKQGLDAFTEIAVSPEDNIEVRRIEVTNRSGARKIIDLTSYAEVVLALAADDAAHPAYSNLFVQTEIIREQRAILCNRRSGAVDYAAPWMFHLIVPTESVLDDLSYETDRMRFIGRGNTLVNPLALRNLAALSGSEGAVLDPIVAIQCRIILNQEQSASVGFVTGIAETRAACLTLIEKYQDRELTNRVFALAHAHSQSVLRQLNTTQADAQLHGRLADSIIYANASLRADPDILIKNRRGQSGLWGNSISGDLPIVLLQIGEPVNLDFVRQILQAHAYWRLKGLTVDLVVCSSESAGNRKALHDQITALIAAGTEADLSDKPGGIFVRVAKPLPSEDLILLQAVARVVLNDGGGTLAEQINRHSIAEAVVPFRTPVRTAHAKPAAAIESSRDDLLFFNGRGGFSPDGREYVVTIAPGQVTPAPWVNVIANPSFGTIVSESGCANTWSENAHEFLLTPWSNDPISDSDGEAFYLRDEESGRFWSPTPWPSSGQGHYVCRHGFGYSVFTHTEDGIDSELWVYVALDAPIKFAVLKVRNKSGRLRRLSVTGYIEWVLGELRPKSMMHVITEIDPESGALLAGNSYNEEFGERIAFFEVDNTTRSFTGDRTEFIGRNGTLLNPAAMSLPRLSCRVGAALDPCGAIQVPFELADEQEREIIFRLGAARNDDDARQLVKRFRGSAAARAELEKVMDYWKHTLGAVAVETPDPSINVLANGWLVYQVMACRLWGRSAFYQSSGAFGFRDQLQDVMSLVHTEPGLVRAHLLLCASRQFKEGDVQHWWHPPLGRGVRTKCSDDFLWLPLTTCRYVSNTGDTTVLDESIHFLEGRPFKPEEDSYYELPGQSEETATLYEHCARAVKRGLRFGEHGLPLMGTGDWNDGMNKVGVQGKGESIWLGFFLYHVLRQFESVAQLHGDAAFVELCHNEAARLRQSIEQHGWDGEWYRRAYFDDGTPLGSAGNPECKIDSIAQSWSVLSGAGSADRSRMALNALDKHLVHRDDAVIQLLTPPFDKSTPDPGYIKAYVPGVRENGAQYTHAAVWAAIAFAAIGDNRRAWELLSIINPVNHSANAESIAIYKVEPYVIASDVYALSPHTGRGGWTWYSGSAGWMYRLIVESILGLRREADKLHFEPCIPAHWTSFKMSYRYRETVYRIKVSQVQEEEGATTLTVDDVERLDLVVPLVDDRQKHEVVLRIHIAQR
ncbi:MAG TPA: glycosyl hydrolase family 65 protein [Pyrinomonadaceae bacterium]|nr:glycosyl hydrolase family 65 protein [Pyrinomonadaceae bacterium]